MPRLVGPAGSFTLRGSLGPELTYSVRAGRQYARFQHPPNQPNTAPQLKSRSLFRWLQSAAKGMDFNTWVLWLETGEFKGTTWRAEFTKANFSSLKNAAFLDGINLLPNLLGGIAPQNVTVSPVSHGLHFVMTLPPLPTGIEYIFFQVAIINEQHTGGLFAGRYHSAFVLPPATALTVGGLNTGQLYRVQGVLGTTLYRGFDRMGTFPSVTATPS